jgi:outer membrane protein OmpA-like peptidoglycan-associated protein
MPGWGKRKRARQVGARRDGEYEMQQTLPMILILLLSAGCATAPPPPAYSSAPPPPAYERVPALAGHPPASHAPAAPRPIKAIGAGVLAQNAVEGYMDSMEGELRGQLRGSGIVIQRSGDMLLLNIRDGLLFSSDALSLSSHGESFLERIAYTVRKFDSSLVVVNGYTDTTGTSTQNLTVSQKRADAVVKQLADEGVEQKRLAGKGFGDEILEIPTGPNVAEPRNRRIEIRISPLVKS